MCIVLVLRTMYATSTCGTREQKNVGIGIAEFVKEVGTSLLEKKMSLEQEGTSCTNLYTVRRSSHFRTDLGEL